jgi:ribosomal protein S10
MFSIAFYFKNLSKKKILLDFFSFSKHCKRFTSREVMFNIYLLPKKSKKFTVVRSPMTSKGSREQFIIQTFKLIFVCFSKINYSYSLINTRNKSLTQLFKIKLSYSFNKLTLL